MISKPFSARVSPVSVSLSLATAPISPACNSVTGCMVLPMGLLDVRQALGGTLVDVLQVGVVLNDAGIDAEEVDTRPANGSAVVLKT